MRISVDNQDKGFDNYLKYNCSATIYLDGVEQKYCTTVDEEHGYIEIMALDNKGKPKIDRDKLEIVTETIKGKVEVRLRHEIGKSDD